jgi:roadblock/LC7 domain-containing protein
VNAATCRCNDNPLPVFTGDLHDLQQISGVRACGFFSARGFKKKFNEKISLNFSAVYSSFQAANNSCKKVWHGYGKA